MFGVTAIAEAALAALGEEGAQVASAPDSVATVPNGTVGLLTSIVVEARDEFGSNMTTGGAVVVVSITGANTATPAVVDVGDGTYATSYTPANAGDDSVAVTLGGVAISGSPYTSVVAAVGGGAGAAGRRLSMGLGIGL